MNAAKTGRHGAQGARQHRIRRSGRALDALSRASEERRSRTARGRSNGGRSAAVVRHPSSPPGAASSRCERISRRARSPARAARRQACAVPRDAVRVPRAVAPARSRRSSRRDSGRASIDRLRQRDGLLRCRASDGCLSGCGCGAAAAAVGVAERSAAVLQAARAGGAVARPPVRGGAAERACRGLRRLRPATELARLSSRRPAFACATVVAGVARASRWRHPCPAACRSILFGVLLSPDITPPIRTPPPNPTTSRPRTVAIPMKKDRVSIAMTRLRSSETCKRGMVPRRERNRLSKYPGAVRDQR